MNPYIVIAVIVIIDIISIPFAIKSILKKNIKHKGIILALFLAVFIAVEAIFSVLYIDSHNFYDREGNTYTSQEDVVYYDKDCKEFILYHQIKQDRWHFISKDGKNMYTAERMYLDTDGYLVYDRDNTFKQTELKYIYKDANGNEYFRADEMTWNKRGEMKPRSE